MKNRLRILLLILAFLPSTTWTQTTNAPAPADNKLPDTWIVMQVEVAHITSDGWLVCTYIEPITSSGGDTSWRELYPSSHYQKFVIVGHPRSGEVAEGDKISSGVIVSAGVAKTVSGKTMRKYQFISEQPQR